MTASVDAQVGRDAQATGTRRSPCWTVSSVLVKSPGVRGDAPLVAAARERGIPVWSEIELGVAPPRPTRSSASPARTGRRRRPSCSARCSARPGGRSRSPGTSARALTSSRSRRVPADDWIVCELSSFQLEDVESLRPRSRCSSTWSPTTSTGTATSRRTGPRSCGSSRTRPRRTRRCCRAGSSRCPAARRVEFAADDPLPAEPLHPGRAQPRERRRRGRRRPRRRTRRRGDRGGAAHVPGRPAPARARRRDRRRPLRQRLEGDERRRRAPRR